MQRASTMRAMSPVQVTRAVMRSCAAIAVANRNGIAASATLPAASELPDGTKKVVLSVPRYDFNWQTYYMFTEPLQVPKGARLVSSAWYDNSAANPSNPDPKVDVKWGDQTWEEMQYTGLLLSVKPR